MGRWSNVTMDSITKLPLSKLLRVTYNSILIVVNHIIKMAHYILALSTWEAEDLTMI